MIADALKRLAALGRDFEPLWQRIERASAEVLGELSGARLTHGFCHGGAWLGNVRFAARQTTVFDFDDCCFGPLILDVARLLRTVWDGQRADFVDLAPGILDAYATASGVDRREFRAIPALARLGEIATLGFLARYCTMDDATWTSARVMCAQRLQDWAPDGPASRALLTATAGTR